MQIKEKFGHSLELASKGELDHWKSTARGRVALVILLDQFSRNIYRDTPRSFAQDEVALDISLDTINKVSEFPTRLRKFQSGRLAIETKQKLLSLGVNVSSILSMIYLVTWISRLSLNLQEIAWLAMVCLEDYCLQIMSYAWTCCLRLFSGIGQTAEYLGAIFLVHAIDAFRAVGSAWESLSLISKQRRFSEGRSRVLRVPAKDCYVWGKPWLQIRQTDIFLRIKAYNMLHNSWIWIIYNHS